MQDSVPPGLITLDTVHSAELHKQSISVTQRIGHSGERVWDVGVHGCGHQRL